MTGTTHARERLLPRARAGRQAGPVATRRPSRRHGRASLRPDDERGPRPRGGKPPSRLVRESQEDPLRPRGPAGPRRSPRVHRTGRITAASDTRAAKPEITRTAAPEIGIRRGGTVVDGRTPRNAGGDPLHVGVGPHVREDAAGISPGLGRARAGHPHRALHRSPLAQDAVRRPVSSGTRVAAGGADHRRFRERRGQLERSTRDRCPGRPHRTGLGPRTGGSGATDRRLHAGVPGVDDRALLHHRSSADTDGQPPHPDPHGQAGRRKRGGNRLRRTGADRANGGRAEPDAERLAPDSSRTASPRTLHRSSRRTGGVDDPGIDHRVATHPARRRNQLPQPGARRCARRPRSRAPTPDDRGHRPGAGAGAGAGNHRTPGHQGRAGQPHRAGRQRGRLHERERDPDDRRRDARRPRAECREGRVRHRHQHDRGHRRSVAGRRTRGQGPPRPPDRNDERGQRHRGNRRRRTEGGARRRHQGRVGSTARDGISAGLQHRRAVRGHRRRRNDHAPRDAGGNVPWTPRSPSYAGCSTAGATGQPRRSRASWPERS